ncbi:hypothetical protein HWV62_28882 [Athelia sp. TMB]|nr:hypothetical protein HWV62_28882 [Athelia sp. TMB]
MTISQDPQAPLIVVCGATGIQGGSVIEALAESDKPYRFRGLTRDTNKPVAWALASRGVEMLQVDLKVENEPNVVEAFKGANISFVRLYVFIPKSYVDGLEFSQVVTNFWEHKNKQREIDEGQMLVRVSKTVGVSLLVWSGLESVSELSGGRLTHVFHFDSKAAVTRYAQEIGVPFVNVQAGQYASNYTQHWRPRKQADGSYAIKLPWNSDSVAPVIDMVADYGLFVREAIEEPVFGAGTEILTCGEMLSFRDAAAQLSQKEFAAQGRMPVIEVEDIRQSLIKYGYYGGKDIAPSLIHLARMPRTFAEFAKEQDWEAIID